MNHDRCKSHLSESPLRAHVCFCLFILSSFFFPFSFEIPHIAIVSYFFLFSSFFLFFFILFSSSFSFLSGKHPSSLHQIPRYRTNHNFAFSAFATNSSSPFLISSAMPSARGLLLSRSTKTCTNSATALTSSAPLSNTPISYCTLLFPNLFTRRPRSSSAGNPTGPK